MVNMANFGEESTYKGFSFFVGLLFVVYVIYLFAYTSSRVSVFYNRNLFNRMLNDYKAKVFDFNR